MIAAAKGAGDNALNPTPDKSSMFYRDGTLVRTKGDAPVYDDGYMYNWNPANGSVIVAQGTFSSVKEKMRNDMPVFEVVTRTATPPRQRTTISSLVSPH